MNRLQKIITLSFLVISSIFYADDFPSQIIVIGDSLSDEGNSRATPLILVDFVPFSRPSPITSGITWPVYLANFLDAQSIRPSTQGGTNFAYVGALTEGSFAGFPNPSLKEQLDFIPQSLKTSYPVFLLGGANDIFFDPTTILTPGIDAANNMKEILQSLHNRGFDTLIVINLPDIGQIPSAGANSTAYTQESLNYNATLKKNLNQLNFPVFEVDLFTVFNAIIANPEQFGLVNTSTAPVLGTGAGENTAGFLYFYDGTHPTDAAHRLIAEYVFSLLNGPIFLGDMLQKPITAIREHSANLKHQLYPIQPEHCCNCIYPFISGNYSPVENPPLTDSCLNRNQHGGDVTFGLTDRVLECLTLGVAGGYAFDWSKFEKENNELKFDLRAWSVSALASWYSDCAYLNGLFTAAFLDFCEIKRKFLIGPTHYTAKADTSGIDYSGNLYGAYHFIFCDCSLSTGPLFDLNYQYISIDGYTEKRAQFGNLEYKGIHRKQFTSGLGWELRFEHEWCCVDWVWDLFLLGNYQWFENKDKIRFRETSISGAFGSWPIKSPTNGFLSGGAHITGTFPCDLIGTLGYDFNVGNDGMSEHFITLSFTIPIWCSCCD